MIGIDTNVLLRYLLYDDSVQSPLATRLIENSDAVIVSNVVLAETVWVLSGKKYSIDPEEIVNTLYCLFRDATVRLEKPQVVWTACKQFESALTEDRPAPDFPDVLILCIAKDIATSRGESFEGAYTFDKAAQRLGEMKSP